jgi:hypothetical protein
MALSKRVRGLAWEGLGWSVAAGLAVALVITVGAGLANERALNARLAAAEARTSGVSRTLAICEATSATLKNTLATLQAAAAGGASTSDGPLTPEALLARQAAGADACARAYEAEALVREATR